MDLFKKTNQQFSVPNSFMNKSFEYKMFTQNMKTKYIDKLDFMIFFFFLKQSWKRSRCFLSDLFMPSLLKSTLFLTEYSMKWNKNPLIMLINASQLVKDNYIQSVISVHHRATLPRFATAPVQNRVNPGPKL